MRVFTALIVVSSVAAFAPLLPFRLQSPSSSLRLESAVIEMDNVLDTRGMQFSGLQGKALLPKEYPTLSEVKNALPSDTYVRSTTKSLTYAALDILTTSLSAFLGIKFLLPLALNLFTSAQPLNQVAAVALWAFYSIVVGTCAIGGWVTAHECGHGAFSDNRKLQDTVGYILHSLMLVPYFSWQRSHAVHHANTNHAIDGETHVPPIKANPEKHISGKKVLKAIVGESAGEFIFGWGQLLTHLLVGWPAYLLFGATGGTSRGITNHFIPLQVKRPFQTEPMKDLWPGNWKAKVFISDIGVVAVAAGLFALAKQVGWQWVAAAYGGPYLVINAWLVGYTWLQHTDVDIPHLPSEKFSFIKGAFHTVDRPYENMFFGVIDFLHHHIGSTHGKLTYF